MMDDYVNSLLRMIGLSKYQLRVYLTLVERGPLTAGLIAKYADVPSSKVYSVLKSMVRLGLIDVDSGKRPEVFVAKPPKEMFNIVVSRINDIVEKAKPMINTLQMIYEASNQRTIKARSEMLFTVKGLQNTKNLARVIMLGNVKEVSVAIPYSQLLDDEVASMIIEATEKSEVKLLVTRDLVDYAKTLPPRVSLRVRDMMFGAGFIGDGVLLTIQYGADYLSLYSTQEYIIEIAKTYFETLWRESEPINR
ncbi:TrmB family transcriptional regulator [Caldivirga maquilingensis]|uniref:Transcriptional regulator, TrmB n=1 Tax=Caldivirga maquilingensis (strain ATCC 700844 / DSM 13496 / JCM 10307 / IC-167) TaxID=397948 RepID=A8MA70_CALMQ|nr:helix-turn-helix domain-containing protein [Caldivirga maquilingensis]ABW01002.1 transcriptional regulator, TrmB [Caldivirga maquilingensis IC-167]